MSFPPLSLEFYGGLYRLPALLLWKGVEKTCGLVWKTIYQTTHQLYQLMLLISEAVRACFAIPLQDDDGLDRNDEPSLEVKSEFSHWKSPGQALESSEIDLNLQILGEFDEEASLNQQEEEESPNSSFNLDFNKDPLSSMGDIPLNLDKRINDLKNENGAIILEDEILDIVKEIIDPALDLLKEIEIKKPTTLQEYLELTIQLEEKYLPLQRWISAFENDSPTGHQLMQKTRSSLEEKRNELEKDLSLQMRRHYQVNNAIPSDGHCLFWSIDDQVKGKKGVKYYRKLAADFIRNHSEEFESGITDALSSSHVKSRLVIYTKLQGGKKALSEKLEKKLKRTPTLLDFYCDCLENSTLWGGINEIIALSEKLKVPFLVFTQNTKMSWRFDSKIGLSKFKKPPILLHYNGTNHYRSLIPK